MSKLPGRRVNDWVLSAEESSAFTPLQGGKSLQSAEMRSSPTQTRPPNAGAGFPHVRLLCRVPISHDLEHDPHPDQDVQCPSRVQLVTFGK